MIETAEDRRKNIARQIRQAMNEAGINNVQLAERMGKTPSHVTKWLSGKHNFTSDTLAELSIVLGVNITGVEKEYVPGNACIHSVNEPQNSIYIPSQLRNASLNKARSLSKSIDEYISDLISKDLAINVELPKVSLSGHISKKVKKYSGILGSTPIQGDEKFDRIWNR